MDKVKIGLVGCGSAVWMFMSIEKYTPICEFTAIMDSDVKKLEEIKKQYGIEQSYTDYDEFLRKSGIDAVIIASPPNYHCEQTIKAARKGIHVLCEKPMAPSISECMEMIKACRENNIILMVGFMKRFDKSMIKVKQLIDSGELGSIHQITTKWSWWQGDGGICWRDLIPAGGGLYQDHGSHVTDLCRWWLGEIDIVSAEINVIMEGREVEDNATVMYKHKTGAVSVHLQSRLTHKELTEYYLIDGSRCSLELYFNRDFSGPSHDPFKMYLYKKGKMREDVSILNMANIDMEISKNGRYKKELEYFCQNIQQGKSIEINTGKDGLKAMEAIIAAYLSSYRAEKVTLPLPRESYELEIQQIFSGIKKRSPYFEK